MRRVKNRGAWQDHVGNTYSDSCHKPGVGGKNGINTLDFVILMVKCSGGSSLAWDMSGMPRLQKRNKTGERERCNRKRRHPQGHQGEKKG